MAQKKGYELLKEKVPEFRSRWKSTAIFIIWFLLFLVCIAFFLWFDRLVWYGALISQLAVALVCSAFAYGHMKNAKKYREKYGKLAYRYFFFHFIMPIFATWFACMFHPILIGGQALLPFWLAILIGVFLLSFRPLTTLHIRKSGFDVGHGLGIYTVYPEEGSVIHGEIYSYVRHPMYLGYFCVALAFAFFRNNLLSLLAALIFLIPVFVAGWLEDRELIERIGEEHKKYIKNTGALFPRKNKIGKFLKLLFFLERGR